MAIFVALYMALGLTLLTILNRHFLHVLFQGGVQGKRHLFRFSLSFLNEFSRCTASSDDLDGPAGRRSREHTELLVKELELGVLWDKYGLVGDIVVSTIQPP
jgi:hypothetical protein